MAWWGRQIRARRNRNLARERSACAWWSAPGGAGRIPDFLIDRFEVTNRAFKQFVDAGGYRDRAHWEHPLVKDGRTLTWEEAVAEFRDGDRPAGAIDVGLGHLPGRPGRVAGGRIQLNEAAACAKFAVDRFQLSTIGELAAGPVDALADPELEQLRREEPGAGWRVPRSRAYGTYDMAGNVKEWCTNEAGDRRRYILGGGWNEPNYQFRQADARLPFDRSANNGIRLIKLADQAEVSGWRYAPEPRLTRDYNREKPVTDEVFAAYRGLFSYDKTDLAAKVESSEDTRVSGGSNA